MKFIKSTKTNDILYLFVTAMDQSVIARPNFKIKKHCWDELPLFSSESDLKTQFLLNNNIFHQFQNIIEENKYSFLFENRFEKDQVLEKFSEVKLPQIYLKELEWLKRFGYYYHHTLAITMLLIKYGIDTKLSDGFMENMIEAALVHDIGLTRLHYNLLFSHALFQDDEKLIMQQHSIISYLLLGYYSGRKKTSVGQIVLHHHSPDKFKEFMDWDNTENINNITWMIHNIGIFDALISNRPFRPSYKVESSLNYLRQLNNTHNLKQDMVNWLTQKSIQKKRIGFCDFLVPFHPELDVHQLN